METIIQAASWREVGRNIVIAVVITLAVYFIALAISKGDNEIATIMAVFVSLVFCAVVTLSDGKTIAKVAMVISFTAASIAAVVATSIAAFNEILVIAELMILELICGLIIAAIATFVAIIGIIAVEKERKITWPFYITEFLIILVSMLASMR